ncbi:hypothetical protein LA080_016221 [Diaporthe eres]|nr:hypothetical protein LA080_016221 [Diaporthe eres]
MKQAIDCRQVSSASEDGAYSGNEESSFGDNDSASEDELLNIEEQEQSDPEDSDPEDLCHKWNSQADQENVFT